ncbi:MgtC/SapB family protein [Candidatus Daviesbacteria bacterium]|nr:MgtC/SapB family protein [Candidatus Daviesbacteria bacterium]
MDLVLKFILAFVIGAVIGIEREVNEKKALNFGQKPIAILGLRSFSLTAALGGLVGVLYADFFLISAVITVAFFALSIVFYVLDSLSTKDTGITTELALIYSFLIGLLIISEIIPIQLTLALSVVLIVLLSRKESIKNIIEDIKRREINAFISYTIIALAILPFLPNTAYSLSDISGLPGFLEKLGVNLNQIINIELINPFKVWIIVALITGIELIGYILERTIGQKKGWLLASAAGGFISSTATTQTMAQQSKKSNSINHLVSAVVIANMVSFIQIAIVIGSLNIFFLIQLLPTIIPMIIGTLIIALFFLMSKEPAPESQTKVIEEKKIIDLYGALKFVALFITISILSKLALAIFGDSGFLVTTGLGALVGLDAVMINTAQAAGQVIDFRLGIIAFILANFVNLAGKSLYSFLHGKKEFAVKSTVSMVIIIFLSLIGLIV